jgi:hypothetical protein
MIIKRVGDVTMAAPAMAPAMPAVKASAPPMALNMALATAIILFDPLIGEHRYAEIGLLEELLLTLLNPENAILNTFVLFFS